MDEDTNPIEVEETQAHIDNDNGEVEVFPDSFLVDKYSDQTGTVSVYNTDYDSGGESDLDGRNLINLLVEAETDRKPSDQMFAGAYLTDEQAQQIALDLLRTSGAGVRNGNTTRNKNGEKVESTYEVTINHVR